MFSKNKLTSTNKNSSNSEVSGEVAKTETTLRSSTESKTLGSTPKSKPAVSSLSTDLVIKGNIQSTGDIQIEGTVEGDIRAHLLTVGIGATIKGEIIADDVVINGKIIGRVRGLKVRLTSSAKVDGDIIHKTIAIESGAHFEGSVQRQDDPLSSSKPNTEFKKID
jgi:cytoskeletal protein CcmA (bactofilin family)